MRRKDFLFAFFHVIFREEVGFLFLKGVENKVEPEIGGIYDSFGRERIREQEDWYGKYADLDEEELAELESEEEEEDRYYDPFPFSYCGRIVE